MRRRRGRGEPGGFVRWGGTKSRVNPTRNANFGIEDGVGTPRTVQLGLRYAF